MKKKLKLLKKNILEIIFKYLGYEVSLKNKNERIAS